jgi:predicted nucleic acid-binding Zn ribbon protein
MNQHRQIELAKSFRANDIEAANQQRRMRPMTDAPTTDAPTTGARVNLVVIRRLILRHA